MNLWGVPALGADAQTVTLGDWTFRRLELEERGMYDAYAAASDYPITVFSSNFAYIWGNPGPGSVVLWKEIDGMLALFKYHRRYDTLHLPILPLGPGSPDHVAGVLLKAMSFCREWNRSKNTRTRVRVIDDLQYAFLSRSRVFRNYFRCVVLDGMERHASVRELLTLPGSEFRPVRYALRRFEHEFPEARVRRAEERDRDALLELKREWNESAGAKYTKVWDDVFFNNLLNHAAPLGQSVLVLDVGGTIAAAGICGISPNGQGWFTWLKYRKRFPGASSVMYIEIAKEVHRLHPDAELINLGHDAGVSGGLRAFKNKFQPVLDTKRLRVFFRGRYE